MVEEYRGKVFKSGNSMALRLPKALGLIDGDEMRIVREDRHGFHVESLDQPKRKFNVAKVAGSAPDLRPIKDEDRVLDHSPRPWDDPEWPGWESVRA